MTEKRLDLGANGVHTFRGPGELTAWIQADLTAWNFVSPSQPAAVKHLTRKLSPLTTMAETALKDEGAWSNFQEKALEAYRTLPRHDSPRGLFISGLRQEGDAIAAAAFATFIRASLNSPVDPASIRGAVAAAAYEVSTLESLGQATKVLDRLNHDFQEWWQSAKSEQRAELAQMLESRKTIAGFQTQTVAALETQRAEAGAAVARLTKTCETGLEAMSAKVRDQVEGYTKALDQMTTQNAAKMASIEKTYEEKLALHEAVSYWRKKRASHWRRALAYGVLFGITLVGGTGLVIAFLPEAKINGQTLLPLEVDWAKFPLGRAIVVGAILTGIIWIVRTFARLFFSNLHMHADADERAVMVTTYLALIREGAALKDDDRRLVIEALFRRASTGFVRQDAEPPLFLASALRRGDV